MRLNNLAALLAASSLMLASSPAISAPAPAPVAAPASASMAEESELLDSGFIGVALVFGFGLIAGYLLYTVLKGDDDEEPASP